MSAAENATTKAVIDLIFLVGGFAWRNNTGAGSIGVPGRDDVELGAEMLLGSFEVERPGVLAPWKRKGRFVRYGFPGSGDVIGCLPGGKFISVEIKRPKDPAWLVHRKRRRAGRMSKLQLDFKDEIEKRGGVAICVDSSQQFEAWLKQEGYR